MKLKAARSYIESIVTDESHVFGKWLFQKVVYIWLFITALSMLPAHESFFGPKAYIPQKALFESGRVIDRWYGILDTVFGQHTLVLLLFYICVLMYGILFATNKIIQIFVLVAHGYLMAKAWATTDGAINLYELFSIYLIGINLPTSRKYQSSFLSALSVGVSNFSFFLCQIQLVTVYFVASIAKISGAMWANGTALFYILQGDYYSVPLVHELLFRFPLFFVFSTYFTLGVQISLWTLIWGKLRFVVLSLGVLLHLGIAFLMGLFLFGLAMIMSYSIFLPENLCEHFYERALSLRLGVGNFFKSSIQRPAGPLSHSDMVRK